MQQWLRRESVGCSKCSLWRQTINLFSVVSSTSRGDDWCPFMSLHLRTRTARVLIRDDLEENRWAICSNKRTITSVEVVAFHIFTSTSSSGISKNIVSGCGKGRRKNVGPWNHFEVMRSFADNPRDAWSAGLSSVGTWLHCLALSLESFHSQLGGGRSVDSRMRYAHGIRLHWSNQSTVRIPDKINYTASGRHLDRGHNHAE